LDEISGAPIDTTAVMLLIKRAERNADKRQKACHPAKRGTCQYDAAVVQYQQDTDKPENKASPLKRRYPLAQKAIGNGRGEDGLKAQDQR
jgi:hypothetical protein